LVATESLTVKTRSESSAITDEANSVTIATAKPFRMRNELMDLKIKVCRGKGEVKTLVEATR